MAERDPIARYKAALLQRGDLAQRDIDRIEARVKAAAEDALAYAQSLPFPDASELATDVYA